MERKFPGTKVSPMELSFLGTKVLGYESSSYCVNCIYVGLRLAAKAFSDRKKCHGF